MMAWLNLTTLLPSAVATVSECEEENAALPCTTCTLRALAKPDNPPVSFLITLSFQLRKSSKAISGLPIFTPKCDISSASVMTLAACNSALEGIQPTFKQTPPKVG